MYHHPSWVTMDAGLRAHKERHYILYMACSEGSAALIPNSPLKKVWHWLPASVFTGKMPVPHCKQQFFNRLLRGRHPCSSHFRICCVGQT